MCLQCACVRFGKSLSISLFLCFVKRAAQKNDLVMPCDARAVAHELGIAYYETSVFTYFGVNEVFENAIRAALIQRRHQRFWMTNLKRVKRPILQVINNRTKCHSKYGKVYFYLFVPNNFNSTINRHRSDHQNQVCNTSNNNI